MQRMLMMSNKAKCFVYIDLQCIVVDRVEKQPLPSRPDDVANL